MITDGDYTYVWWSNTQALKMKNNWELLNTWSTDEDNSNIDNQNTQKNLNQIPYSKCSEWTADNSMFALPVWVDFMDMSQIQNNMMKQIPNQQQIDQMIK